MDIEAISSAATVAIACTIVYLLVALSWQGLTRAMGGGSSFRDSIMREAAQRFRDQLDTLSRAQATYLGAGLVFVVIFAVAHALQAQELFAGYARWQLQLLLLVLFVAFAFAAYKTIYTFISWRHVRFLRDANLAVGHQLQRVATGHGRVFHDVPTSAGIVDHVIVGHNGVYAVNVVAHRLRKNGTASLEGNEIAFSPGDKTESIVDIAARTKRLAHEFSKMVGHQMRVRSVIAVPGWDIEGQADSGHLLVNERNLPMLLGWKDKADYLMNEDVDTLFAHLTVSCTRS